MINKIATILGLILAISLLLNQNFYAQASAEEEKALSKPLTESLDATEFYSKGLNYLDREMYDEAIESFRKATKADPGFFMPRLAIIIAYLNKFASEESVSDKEYKEMAIEYRTYISLKEAKYADVGMLEEAIRRFERAVRTDDKNVRAHIALGVLYGVKGVILEEAGEEEEVLMEFIDKNIKEFKVVLELNPSRPASAIAHLALAMNYRWWKASAREEAISEFQKAIELAPTWGVLHEELGGLYEYDVRYDEAIAEYKELVRLEPDYPEGYRKLGEALQEQNRFDEAITAYKEVIRLKPDYAEGYKNLGSALENQGKFDEAIAVYREGLLHLPDNADLHRKIGEAYSRAGAFSEAITAYKKLLELQPDDASAYEGLGSAFRQNGMYDDAIAAYEKALKLQEQARLGEELPSSDYVIFDMLHIIPGITQTNKGLIIGNPQRAIYQDGDNLIAMNGIPVKTSDDMRRVAKDWRPGDEVELTLLRGGEKVKIRVTLGGVSPARRELFSLYFEKDMKDKAASVYLEMKPEHFAYYQLGEAYVGESMFDEAISAYKKAIELKPDYHEARRKLADALQRKGKHDEAISQLKEAIQAKSDDWETYVKLAEVYIEKGMYDEAIAQYEQAKKLQPNNSSISYALGSAYFGKGDYEQTIAYYNEVLKLKPDNDEIRIAIGKASYWKELTEERAADKHYRDGWLLLIISDFTMGIDAKIHFEKAIKEFESAVRQTPNKPEFYEALLYASVSLASRYSLDVERKNSLISMAVTAIEKAVEFGKDTARLHFYLGMVYSFDIQTHYTDAVREFEKASEMESQNALPMYWLASVYAQKQADEAMFAALKAAGRRQQYTLYLPMMTEEYALAYPPYVTLQFPTTIIRRVQVIATAYAKNGKSEKAIEVNQTLFDYGRHLIGSQPGTILGPLWGIASITVASRLYADRGMEEEVKRVERIKTSVLKLRERVWHVATSPPADLSRKWDKISSPQERFELWFELWQERYARESRVVSEITREFLSEWEGH